MNEVLKAIKERRSIRKFLPTPVPQDSLQLMVEAGLWAPSARNIQPWFLTVLSGAGRIKDLNNELKAAVARMPGNPYKAFVGADAYAVSYLAPTLIIVSADAEKAPLAPLDCALVLQNIFLAAHSLGFGSCWINQLGSACADPVFRAFITDLGVPPQNHIYGAAALGYPDGPAATPPARKGEAVKYIG